jgi:hypothetical protein
VGCNLGVDGIVVESKRVAVILTGLIVYPNGLVLQVDVYARNGLSLLGLWGGPEMTAAYRVLEGEPAADINPFHLSVTYSDGRVARPYNAWATGERTQPPFLAMQGGSGGSEEYNMKYWLHPLPLEGDLEFHCSWDSEGVTDSLLRIEGDPLREAAQRAHRLWWGD